MESEFKIAFKDGVATITLVVGDRLDMKAEAKVDEKMFREFVEEMAAALAGAVDFS